MIDHLNCLDVLESSDNPFAMATLAYLETQQTRQNWTRRFESKLRFIKSLYAKGWTREKIIKLFHFIDWMMRLPDNLDNMLWVEILKIEEETKMRYVSSVERIGYDRGWDEGIIEGKTEGKTEGITQGRIEAIELGLILKFGDDAVRLLMPLIRNLKDPDRLLMIRDAIRAAENLEDIRQLIKSPLGQA